LFGLIISIYFFKKKYGILSNNEEKKTYNEIVKMEAEKYEIEEIK
jgi:hypothetical protein